MQSGWTSHCPADPLSTLCIMVVVREGLYGVPSRSLTRSDYSELNEGENGKIPSGAAL